MEIIAGVHAIEGVDKGRAYLYQEADRLTLIDTGLAGSAERIWRAIGRIGRRPEDLQQIVITHYHADHTGSLADVVERTNAQVLAHALDAPVVRGEEPAAAPRLSKVEEQFFEALTKDVPPAPPSRVDRELVDGDEIDLDGDATVVHVPGHTPGSIAIYLPMRRVLFSGDAVERDLEGRVIVGVFNVDPDEARRSFLKVAQLDFDAACFGHGEPMDREASLVFRRLAETLR